MSPAGTRFPRIELRTEGTRGEVLVDGHLLRGVTDVTVSKSVKGLAEVQLTLITDRLTAVSGATGTASLDDADTLLQRAVLDELREAEACPRCGVDGGTRTAHLPDCDWAGRAP